MEEAKEIVLSDGKRIVLEDDDDIVLSIISNDKTEDKFPVFRPGCRRVPPDNAMGRGDILQAFAKDPYSSV